MPEGNPDLSLIDIHFHAGPDIYRRKYTTREAAKRFADINGWAVIKSHLGSTAAQTWEARQEGLPVSGAVVLNELAGGLKPQTVEQSLFAHGEDTPARLMVYLPTLGITNHKSKLHRETFHSRINLDQQNSQPLFDPNGHPSNALKRTLSSMGGAPVVLATGHCNREDSHRVIEEALSAGIEKIVLTHATHPMSGFSVEDIADLAQEESVYIELTALTLQQRHQEIQHMADLLAANPRLILSSDFGQEDKPSPGEYRRLSRSWANDLEISEAGYQQMTLKNPRELLGL
ncbi:DUF6282 family protein (plasmid) [Glutamicibacter sp. FR1]|uniref:DUF6282 family protein n=1 Tax=Glutamicibacter sp. FR1 TaxID=3393744 RepID=UPI0039B11AEC